MLLIGDRCDQYTNTWTHTEGLSLYEIRIGIGVGVVGVVEKGVICILFIFERDDIEPFNEDYGGDGTRDGQADIHEHARYHFVCLRTAAHV